MIEARRFGGAAAFGLVLATLACGLSPATQATPGRVLETPVSPDWTPSPEVGTVVDGEEWLMTRMDQVDEGRLLADVEALAAIHSRHVNSPGIAQAADHIAAGFTAAGLTVEPSMFALDFRGVTTEQRNVIGVIPGSDSAAGGIVLGAHYDSRTVDIGDWDSAAPGANDNASGVAVLLEVARVLGDFRPRRPIYLVAFAAEETGLHGSRHLAQHGPPAVVAAMLAFDIVGNSDRASPGALRIFSQGPEGSPSRRLAHEVAAIAARRTPELRVLVQDALDRPGRSSDHVPFSDLGIPAARLIEEPEHVEWQHNDLDTPERLDPAFLRRVARLAVALAVELGGADGP